MSKKVFCGGLPWATDDSGLATAMSEFGVVVEAKVITDRETGRSRGFGFVTFASEEEAEEALQVGTLQIDGRAIRIDEPNERPRGKRK